MTEKLWFHVVQGAVSVVLFALYLWYRTRRKEAPLKGLRAFLPRDFVDVIALGLLLPRLFEHYLDIANKIGG